MQTAIFGGTFNPPHIGHSVLLAGLSKRPEIGRILVMPVCLPPHKSAAVVPAKDRLAMCRLAFSDLPKIELREDEISSPGKSYTVLTLERLQKLGIRDPILVIGADSLVTFDRWYRYLDILNMAQLLVYQRQGVAPDEVRRAADRLRSRGGRIRLLDDQPPKVSSTEIRQRLKTGAPVDGMLKQKVAEYIQKNHLYTEE